ncbi:MAG TPA: cytochrome c [Pyrinomonadaceae bacterium]|nr:cytochrome c [Pyrinomonadaceae bacterium]
MKKAKARRGDAETRRRGEKESANLMRLLYLRVPASPRLRVVVFSLLLFSSCKREERGYRVQPPAAGRVNSVSLSELRPGETLPPPAPVKNEYENNAYAMNEGKRLYEWFNCVGCHAHGGGAIGPPLMDDKWIYGSQPEQVFSTIVQGRPNGMPSFSGKIPDYEVWQLVAYVRSMSGQVPGDAAPGRNDDMNTTKPEQVKGKEEPKGSGEPK